MTDTVKKKRKYVSASQRTEALAQLEQGSTFAEVAERLDVREDTVRRWHRDDERARREGRGVPARISMPIVGDQAILDHLREREVDYGVGTPASVRVRYSEPDIEGRAHLWLIDRGCTVLGKVFVDYDNLERLARSVLLAILEQVQRIQRLAYTGEQSDCREVHLFPPPPRRKEQS